MNAHDMTFLGVWQRDHLVQWCGGVHSHLQSNLTHGSCLYVERYVHQIWPT